jgi:hypothetical protein
MRERLRIQREAKTLQSTETPDSSEKPESKDTGSSAKPRTLRDVFSEEKASSGGDDESNASGSQSDGKREISKKAPKLSDLNALAETLNVKPEDLYKVKIPLGNDQELTLGEIKDLASKDHDFDSREFEFEERRSKQEGDLLRARNEIEELLAIIPPKLLNKELLNKARAKHGMFVESQRRETLALIPEWKDEKRRESEMAEMIDHLHEYGISKAEFVNIIDAKAIRYIRVNWLRQKRVAEMMEKVEQQNRKGNAPARSSNGKAPKRPPAREPKSGDSNRSRMLSILNR